VKQSSLSAEDVSHKEVAKWFKPELLNRIEKVIFFDKLSDETYQVIIETRVKQFVSEVNSKCKVQYDSSLIEFIQSKLTEADHALGARPVSRIINEHLKIPVSKFVLKGINHVSVEVKNNKLEWMEYGEV
jgi:ATP-dependent Clp protease ATP-binding subunit ClpA